MNTAKATKQQLVEDNQRLRREIARSKKGSKDDPFKLLVDSVSDAIIWTDLEFNITEWNKAAERLYGWKQKEVLGKPVQEVTKLEYPNDCREKVLEQFSKKGRWAGEVIQRKKDGTPIHILASVTLLKDREGNPLSIVAINRDISDRKKLQKEKEELAKFPSKNPNPVLRIAKDGTLLYRNKASLPMLKRWKYVKKQPLSGESLKQIKKSLKDNQSIRTEVDCAEKIFSLTYAPVKSSGFVNVYGLDITEHKHILHALHTSLVFSQNLIDTANAIIITLDENADIASFNSFAERLSGYDRKDVVGKNWFETFIPKRDQSEIPAVFKNVLREMPEASYHENPIVCKNGEERLIAWRNSVLKDQTGLRTGVLSIGIDITGKKRAQESLRESETRHRALFEGAAEGILVADLKTKRFQYANPAICRMLGYSQTELLELSIKDIHPKTDLEYVLSEFEQQASGKKTKAESIPCRRKNGSIFYTDVNSSVAVIDGEECMVGFFTDITERREAEMFLYESEERLRIAGKAAYDLIYEWDIRNDALEWFGDIDGLLGFREEKISRDIQAWLDLIHPEDKIKLEEAVELHRTSTEPIEYQYRVKHKDGTYRYWNDHGLPVLDDNGRPYKWIGVCTDITERKKTEKELAKYRERLEDLVRERTAEIEEKNKELERLNQLFVGREFRIKELKEKIHTLEASSSSNGG